jgi:pyruvate,water dikinase
MMSAGVRKKIPAASTGIPSLDDLFQGLLYGDNVVWQVDHIRDYLPFIPPLVAYIKKHGLQLIYFRFARHQKLVEEQPNVEVHMLNPNLGFEQFITRIHDVITKSGRYAYYIFDSHSELVLDCYGDHMLGNFFVLICPYLHQLDTIAYFSVQRNLHSYHAAVPTLQTTQLLIDVFRYKDDIYIQPIKVKDRFSPSIFMLHKWDGSRFKPISDSAYITEILTTVPWQGLQSSSSRSLGIWDRRFMKAEEILVNYERGDTNEESLNETFEYLLPQIISRDEQILNLARKYFTLKDIIQIWKRMIGTGEIGGKAVGMLLARAILKKENPALAKMLEAHDSFYIGSDVYYTYLVQNDCWHLRQKQKTEGINLEIAAAARARILKGNFPQYIIERFSDMLHYFGQSPIIVRSSSILEDNFGNAFAGMYESIFCPNQGVHQQRLEAFLHAIQLIYASTMSEEALSYRSQRGVLEKDEQMALLVQRVSGRPDGRLFYPHLAGVGFSFNPYVWHKNIDPGSGMLRLVFGLGTRAVNRHDDDYTRVVALNKPALLPESDGKGVKRYAQRHVDVLDLENNQFISTDFVDIAAQRRNLPVNIFASMGTGWLSKRPSGIEPWTLTFETLFSKTAFIQDMKAILHILRRKYKCHVDIEFTTNFLEDGSYRINVVQCRPFQFKSDRITSRKIPRPKADRIIIKAQGGIIGHSRLVKIDRILYVLPEAYGRLSTNERYQCARIVGKIAHANHGRKRLKLMLIGPGRWGTSMPQLGVPVSFSEINTASVICEIDTMHEGLVPDLSLGTHFFNDMVEFDMLYMAYFAAKKGNILKNDLLLKLPNHMSALYDAGQQWEPIIRVLHAKDLPKDSKLYLRADSEKQVALLFYHIESSTA